MGRRSWIVAVVAVLAAGVTGFLAADDASSSRPQDEAAVRAASQSFAQAFEKGDAATIAALFTEEGAYVEEEGKRIKGRAALAKAYGEFVAKRPDLKVESKADSINFLSKDTAVEEGTFTVKSKLAPAASSRFSTLYVRQDGKWLIALLKEWGDDKTNAPTLDDLAWLIGTWESEGGDGTARTTYEWTPNKKFIHVQYSITLKKGGEKPMTGTQVIGVDPASDRIHSWLFDSDGGIGEATWSFDGERWVIDSAGTLPDGSDTTAQNFLMRSGDDAFTWRSVKRTVDGDSQPDLGMVKVKRVAGGK
jgi:uncharacterized protein (TIGR02246 family)